MKDGLLKICAATPTVTVADCPKNGEQILRQIESACEQGAKIVVFPELCITGATCGDLFRSTVLLQSAMETLRRLVRETAAHDVLCAVGLPVLAGSQVYNCCALFQRGQLLGLVPKQHLTSSEQRVFSPGNPNLPVQISSPLWEEQLSLSTDLIVTTTLPQGCTIGVEIGSDSDFITPPSAALAAQYGVTLILHPSATPETVDSAEHREQFHQAVSRQLCCGYITAEAGDGESTTDQVYGGHRIIAENGGILGKSDLFTTGLTISEIDFDYLRNARLRRRFPAPSQMAFDQTIQFDEMETVITREVSPSPFLPMTETSEIQKRIQRILSLQCAGLGKRLTHTHCQSAVVGLSGGLDSTLALLVTARTFDQLHLERNKIVAISMPCFGTTSRTKSNAQRLAEALSVSFREISIDQAVRQHFLDIGQSMECHDVTFENGQARERTQVLMDVANQLGGIVIGTGDLSELALGWATYNGDHMSMYGINGAIPKTLMRHIVRHIAAESSEEICSVLYDILDTPVSPELLPAKDGEIAQKSEELVGPYTLHDFFLYHALQNGFSPTKIRRLALLAFDGVYGPEVIEKWLQNFYRRFFQQQFKRSCLPDGPAVGPISLSPRGSWMMPSDASGAVWQAELQ
jgi:NAD+ synthase (glutamine-hydrolysing)